MSKTTFQQIVFVTVPATITAATLLTSLKDLTKEVKGGNVTGILVDVSALSKNEAKLKAVGEAVGPEARKLIDPVLKSYGVKKVAFVEPRGKYHGRAPGKLPLKKPGTPTKNYFKDFYKALDWLLA